MVGHLIPLMVWSLFCAVVEQKKEANRKRKRTDGVGTNISVVNLLVFDDGEEDDEEDGIPLERRHAG